MSNALVRDINPHNASSNLVDKVVEIAGTCWDSPRLLKNESLQIQCTSPKSKQVKNVAIFFPTLGIGGGERLVRLLVNLFQDMGINSIVLTNAPIPEKQDTPPLPKITKHFVLPDSETMQRSNYRSRATVLHDILVDNDVDAFIFAHWYIKTLTYDALIAKGLGISTHLFIQSSFPLIFLDDDLPPRRCDIPFSYRLFDTVVCLSEMDKLFWKNFSDNVRVTYNPLTIAPALENPSKLEGHTVIWPARLNADKCPERVIPIMQKLIELVPDAKLIMVGPVEDNYKMTFLQLAAEYGVGDKIELVGSQPEESMKEWYRQADAFLLTSRREGWSLALGEALSMGVPAVIYDLPYLTLAQCKAVTSIPQGDSIAAASALASLLTDKPLAHRMASIGIEFMMNIASYDHGAFWKRCFEDAIWKHGRIDEETTYDTNALFHVMWRELFEGFWSHMERANENMQSQREISDRKIQSQHEAIVALDEQLATTRAAHQKEMQRLVEYYENSRSLKLGRMLTAVPRRIKTCLNRKEQGRVD